MGEPCAEDVFPIYAADRTQRWIQHAELDERLGGLLGHQLLWAIRPALRRVEHSITPSRGFRATVGSLRRRGFSPRAALVRLTYRARRALPAISCNGVVTDGHLRLWTTENQAKALFGSPQIPGNAFRIRAEVPRAILTSPEISEVAVEIENRSGIQVHRTAPMLARAKALHDGLREVVQKLAPTTIVTASQEHAFCRVSVLLGRECGIPSVYIPHAPTATNRIYADIPHDLALLRGERERGYYVELGARASGIEVVGVPATHSIGQVSANEPPVVVFAPSADRGREEFVQALQLVRDAGIESMAEVLVSPHPRERSMATEEARRVGMGVAIRPTADVLRTRRVVALIAERASGAMMEALYAGIPTVRLGGDPNYLFEEDLQVASLSEPAELRDFVRTAVREGLVAASQQAVRGHVSDIGPAVLRRVQNRLHMPIETGTGVLDSWQPKSKNSKTGI